MVDQDEESNDQATAILKFNRSVAETSPNQAKPWYYGKQKM